jgi:hypothetical protein
MLLTNELIQSGRAHPFSQWLPGGEGGIHKSLNCLGNVSDWRTLLFYLWTMSMFRQITSRPLLVAALVCLPLLIDAQSGKKSKKAISPYEPNYSAVTDTNYRIMGAPLPPLRIVYPQKVVYTNDSLKNDANLILMLFNPTCEHCEDMTIALEKNIGLFQKSHIMLVAAEGMAAYLEFFENGTRVKNFPKIKYGLDSSNIVNNLFNYEMLPQINVYNANRRLIKTFNGLEEIDSLKPYIQ